MVISSLRTSLKCVMQLDYLSLKAFINKTFVWCLVKLWLQSQRTRRDSRKYGGLTLINCKLGIRSMR